MSDAKTINLTIGERIAALKIFDSFHGSLDTLAVLLEDVKQFTITVEEWEQAEKVVTKNPDATESWTWNDEKVLKDIVLQGATVKFLSDEIKKKSDAGEITLKDIALSTLNKKIA